MHAAILSIGDELALGENLNTNSQWLADELAQRGVITVEHRTVDDDRHRIASAVRELARLHDLLIVTGGLGPTSDDLTRDGLNDAVAPSTSLVMDSEARRWLEQWFRGRSKPMPEANLLQAMRPATMRCMENPHGTAPGLAGQLGSCLIFALPGPPREMRPMFLNHVVPAIEVQDEVVLAVKINEFGLGESDAAERLGEMMSRQRVPQIGTTASESIVSARIRARGKQESIEPLIEADSMEIQQRWWPYAFSRDDATLQEVVGTLLNEQNRTLTTAESCTGGLLGKLLVDCSGSSAYYLGGWVCYSNELKTAQLGVPARMIEQHGAVSREVAKAMAAGALERAGTDEALAITGVAGPSGGTEKSPVGTVHIALARRIGDNISSTERHFVFPGDRSTIRDRSAKAAMQMLRFALLDLGHSPMLLWQRGSDLSDANAESADGSASAVEAYIALGSNLDDREQLLASAIQSLDRHPAISVRRCSSYLETDPVGPQKQGCYLNAAAQIHTTLQPRALLEALLEIERQHGRDRARELRWGPRRLDLDILLYGKRIIDEPGLTIPHPRMHERRFVLEPLVEIAPDVRHPFLGESIQFMWERLITSRSNEGIRSP